MAKNLPGLVIKIGAHTKDAIDGLNKVNRAVGSATSGTAKMNAMLSKAGPALGLAAAAAGALAIKLGTDAVQAAMAEEQELSRLNKTLENLGFAEATVGVSAFIDNLQFAANVADSELRPAFSVLLRGTKDVEEAQRALALATDISADGQRSLIQVANALSRGYLGNTTGLMRLNAGLDKATLKTGDMQSITKKLADTFGGQASAQSKTLGGAVKGVQIAWDELSESFGKGLVGQAGDSVKKLEEVEARLRHLQGTAEETGSSINAAGIKYLGAWDQLTAAVEAAGQSNWSEAWDVFSSPTNSKEAYDLANAIRSVGLEFEYTQYSAYNTGNTMQDMSAASDEAADSMTKQKSAADKLKESLDKLNGNDRSVIGNRLALRRLKAQGPGKSGERKGADGKMTQFTTKDDRLDFALQYADQIEGLATSLQANGATDAQLRRVFNQGGKYLDGVVGGKMSNRLLSTPAWLDRGNAGQRAAGQRLEQGGQTNNYYFGDLLVKDAADAAEQARRASRLKALGSGRQAEAARYTAQAGR